MNTHLYYETQQTCACMGYDIESNQGKYTMDILFLDRDSCDISHH